MPELKDRYRGMVLGTAAGDAVGLPAEGIPKRRVMKMFKGPWRHRLVFGYGMLSDDTEHMLFVVQSLLAHHASVDLFVKRLGWCLRGWFISLPAGIGLATARACIKLCLGFRTDRSGVFSAGNGPVMRVAPIGALFASSPERLNTFTEASTRLTHTHPRALIGAKAIAVTAAMIIREELAVRPAVGAFIALLRGIGPEDADWIAVTEKIECGLVNNWTVAEFAESIGQGQGISGYVYHTVPVVLFAWHRHCFDFEKTLTAVWECGGDTDSTGAAAGALAGLTVGESGIPADWIREIKDWPRTTRLLRVAADSLSELKQSGRSRGPVRYFWPGIVLRNTIFLFVVLAHGFRRLLPPY